jgi:hypothetical protein
MLSNVAFIPFCDERFKVAEWITRENDKKELSES